MLAKRGIEISVVHRDLGRGKTKEEKEKTEKRKAREKMEEEERKRLEGVVARLEMESEGMEFGIDETGLEL
jgi:predicted transcriptional regulator